MPVSAQVAGEELRRIEEANDGILRPRDVVDESRPEEAPLHPAFEWRDEVAAEKYREDQARQVIRSVRVVREEAPDKGPLLAYVHVQRPATEEEANPQGYLSTATVMSDADLRQQVIEDAISQYEALHRRYQHIEELAEIHEAIEAAKARQAREHRQQRRRQPAAR